jgi:hypothetical protein
LCAVGPIVLPIEMSFSNQGKRAEKSGEAMKISQNTSELRKKPPKPPICIKMSYILSAT